MTFLRRSDIAFADTPAVTAFGLLRVGSPVLLNSARRIGATPDFRMTEQVSGSGVASYDVNEAGTFLTVGSAAGSAVRQTRARSVYQNGKSLKNSQTFVFAPGQANLRQRVGYFDQNNGVFFQEENGNLAMVLRTSRTGSPVEEVVSQSSWSEDKLDGTGPSGITLDPTAALILVLDLEWLAVGRIRIGFDIDGVIYYTHYFRHSNVIQSAYMQNPNLPLRWEIEATGSITGTASMLTLCAVTDSEGGYEEAGFTHGIDTGATLASIGGNSFGEILAIRMQSAFTEYCTGVMASIGALAATSGNFIMRLVLNPTETAAGTWNPVPNSIMEYNVGRTVTESTGVQLEQQSVAAAANSATQKARDILTFGTGLDGTTDVLSLQIRNLAASGEDYAGSMSWREIY